MALLEVNELKTHFRTDDGIVKAVDGVNFAVEKGKTLGIVGESGSGKSVTCLTIMGLNSRRNTITSGEALFNGEDLISMSPKRLREIRGNDIAMIIKDPDLLIADEPTTALDVTTQAQILELMNRLQREFGSAIIIITHDLGVVAETADDVVVMYAARVVERAPVDNLFNRPHMPYTWGLLGSLPRLDADMDRLTQIAGQPPSLLNPPRGCRFHPRCPYVMSICKEQEPELRPVSNDPGHLQACHLDEQTKDREAAKLLAGTMAEAS